MNDIYLSVIMPVFNNKKYISKAIRSILIQTYSNFEFLILDSSYNPINSIIKSLNDKRIKYYNLPEKSISEALNIGIQRSNGNVLARMDADDISDVKRFEIQLEYLMNTDADIIGTNYYYIDEEGKILNKKIMPEFHKDIEFMMPIESSLLHPTMLCKKEALINTNGYSNKYLVEDVELFLRLFKNNYKFYNVQHPLYYYRFIKKTNFKIRTQKSERIILGYQYLSDFYKTSTGKNQFNEMNLRYALLEYYNGDLKLARKYIYKIVSKTPHYFIKLIRYILITFLGNRLVCILRENYYFTKLNRIIIKIFKFDTNRIKRL